MGTVDFSSVAWGSVEWTNLVTLYLRAYESRSRKPILGDTAAAAAVDRIDYDFARIRRTTLPVSNQYLVARQHRFGAGRVGERRLVRCGGAAQQHRADDGGAGARRSAARRATRVISTTESSRCRNCCATPAT